MGGGASAKVKKVRARAPAAVPARCPPAVTKLPVSLRLVSRNSSFGDRINTVTVTSRDRVVTKLRSFVTAGAPSDLPASRPRLRTAAAAEFAFAVFPGLALRLDLQQAGAALELHDLVAQM